MIYLLPNAGGNPMPGTLENTRKPDAARTRQDILDVARAEFTEHGLTGARVDAIAEKTRTTKRMIYYYFGSKEGLYTAALEQAYAGIRTAEAALDLGTQDPETALRQLIEFTFDYHDTHADFVRLVAVENIHQGQFLARLGKIQNVNANALTTLSAILEKGRAQGVFRKDATPLDVHLMISGLCFHRVSNRYTFGTIFSVDLTDPTLGKRHRKMVTDAVLLYVKHHA
jgi:AcrR family transcriptional regulator